MKLIPVLFAALSLAAISAPASAKAFQCVNGVLEGGPADFVCSTDAQGRIIDVRKREETYGQPAWSSSAGTYGERYADSYTRSQTHVPPAPVTRIVRYRVEEPAPHVTRTYAYQAPQYAYAGPAYEPVSEVHEVRIYRSGREGPGRPCAAYAPAAQVRIYSGCGGAQAYHHATFYGEPSPELAGGASATPAYPATRPVYDNVPVVGLDSGVCDRKIVRIGDDADGRTRYNVCYSDLQPVYGGRVELLYERIELAASRACGGSAGYGAYRARKDCEAQAVEMAVYDTGLQGLVNYHVAKTGGRPRVYVGPLRRY